MNDNNKLFSEMLFNNIENYNGEYAHLLQYIPKFFNLLQNMYASNGLNWKAKFRINLCLGYFSITYDYIFCQNPIEFIPHLFLCSYILEDLKTNYPEYIVKNWSYDEDILDLVSQILEETKVLMGDQYTDVLVSTGIIKFDEFLNNYYPHNKNKEEEKLNNINNEIDDLVNLLRTIHIMQGNGTIVRTANDLVNNFDIEEWSKVEKIIAFSKNYESKYDNSIEKELDKIKRKVTIKLDDRILDD